MGRNGNAPQSLAKTTNRGVPFVSLLVSFVVGLILFLPFPSWQQLVGFITSATMLSFGSGPLVLAAMCKQIPDQERTFRLPGGHTIPFLGFLSSNLIVYWTGWGTDLKLFIAVLLGFALLGVMMIVNRGRGQKEPEGNWKAGAAWYLPWLGGLAILSWMSDDGGLGWLHFDTVIPVIVVFSAVIYCIALQVRLVPEQVERYIEDSRREAESEERQLGAMP